MSEFREEDFVHLRHRRVKLYRYVALTFVGLLLASQMRPRGVQSIEPKLIGALLLSLVVSVIATGVSRRMAPVFVMIIVAIWAAAAWSLR